MLRQKIFYSLFKIEIYKNKNTKPIRFFNLNIVHKEDDYTGGYISKDLDNTIKKRCNLKETEIYKIIKFQKITDLGLTIE